MKNQWLSASSAGLQIRFNPQHTLPPVARRYLNSPVHPIRPKIAHMWNNRDRNTLWWRVSTSQLQSFKRVVRSWCARRTRIAFKEALKHHSFDSLGAPLSTTDFKQQDALIGTLELIIRPSLVNQSHESLQRDTNHLLAKILKKRAINFERANTYPAQSSNLRS